MRSSTKYNIKTGLVLASLIAASMTSIEGWSDGAVVSGVEVSTATHNIPVLPVPLSGISVTRPAHVTLSEMEKANNALAKIMGRTQPHDMQPIIIIQDQRK